ncbi:MAG: galactokinase [Chitinophagaceae bacterium]|nr:galactokinase [Chitinophagaceae bacterium]
MNKQSTEQIKAAFTQRFSTEPFLYFSPGRINIIGEHIDYNDGFVMPAAIDKGVYYAVAPNNSNTLNFYSVDFNESLSIDIADIKARTNWENYVLSVVNQFIKAGKTIGGFDCVLGGDIPRGSGMSSSAAVEGGMAFALNEIFECGFNRKELALLNQRAEHDYPNVKCGIMDQFANMNGKKDSVILLDCRSIEHQYFPLVLDGYSLVLINTKVHHSLASSAYNKRRSQCEEGLMLMRANSPVKSFRDVSKWENLLGYKETMGEEVYNRCLYVVQEIDRTQQAAKLLQQHDLKGLGKLMFATHEGLSKLYEVSCKELDFLVEQAKKNSSVIGSRLMGGGFGGCTINIVANDAVESFINETLVAYKAQFGIDGEAYVVQTDDGVRRIG